MRRLMEDRITIAGLAVLALLSSACRQTQTSQQSSSKVTAPLSPTDQTTADPAVAAEIAGIRVIDNHAHPLRVVGPGEPADDDFDALICPDEPGILPWMRLRDDNPEYIGAWRTFFRYLPDDMSQAHVRELIEAKRKVVREQGDHYPTWILDQLGIETMLANRVSMGRGLPAPRFRWVSYVDALMVPLDNRIARERDSNRAYYYDREKNLLRRYLAESTTPTLPANLEEYLTNVVTATLERQKRDGAVAVKFEAAYLRSLDFARASKMRAAQVYARYVQGGTPPAADYKELQDYLFWYISSEAGRLGLAVHLHTGPGCGSYFNLSDSNPLQLEATFNDASLRRTHFVMVHGGYPFTKEVAYLLSKPNVYADFSAQTFLLSERELGGVLRNWLSWNPEKILFGSDAAPGSFELSWEEEAWQTVGTGRRALALALTGMLHDGEITRERASQLARMVLRENAIKLYNLKSQ